MLENVVIIDYLTLIILSGTMGKAIDEKYADFLMKLCTGILCLINMFVVVYTFINYFDSLLSIGILVLFVFTFFVPFLLFDFINFCSLIHRYFLALLCYICCMPLYLIVLQIYSFSNLHDVSWGNRSISLDNLLVLMGMVEDQIKEKRNRKKIYKRTRTFILLIWVLINIFVGYSMIMLNREKMSVFLMAIALTLLGFQVLKLIGMVIYWIRIKIIMI